MKTKPTTRRKLRSAISNIEFCEPRLLFSTYVVNTTSDATSPGSGLLTLRQAVVDANTNSGPNTIQFSSTVFAPGSMHTITLTQGPLIFTSSRTVTLDGPGPGVLTINGEGLYVFQVDNTASALISGLTETNGGCVSSPDATAYGAGVLNLGMLTLNDVTITGNTATGGSAPYGSSSDGGGAVGAGIYSSGALTLIDSTVSDNTAQAGTAYRYVGGTAAGAGIFSTGGSLTIQNSTIMGNTATGGGVTTGGYADGGPAYGGGVYASGSVSISGSTINKNLANGGDGSDSYATEDIGAPGFGGGLYLVGTTNTISGTTFTEDTASGGNAGGGAGAGSNASGGAIWASGQLAISNSTINDNTTQGGGGAFDDSGAGGTAMGAGIASIAALDISSSSVTNNDAYGGLGQSDGPQVKGSALGGGIYSTASLAIVSSTISGNLASGDLVFSPNDTYAGTGGQALGGGIYGSGGGTITSSTISGNSVRGGVGDPPYHGGTGGAGGLAEGGGIFEEHNITLTNSTIANNTATGGTGGNGGNGGDGGAGGDALGGGIYAGSGDLTASDSTVSGDTTAAGPGGTEGGYGYVNGDSGSASGGGIAIGAGGYVVVSNSIIDADTSGSAEDDIFGSVAGSSNNNLIGVGAGQYISNGVNGNIIGVNNPGLLPLANYGGPTETLLPLYNSPAINAGSNSTVPAGVTTDQRGNARVVGGTVDIGAVELQSGSVSGTVINDLNGDGIQQTGEPGLAGVTVYADLSNAGVYKAGDPTTITNSSGNYTLAGVPEGAAIVRQQLLSGYRQSYPIQAAGEHVNVTAAGVAGALFADSTRLYISGSVTYNGAGQSGVLVYADLNNDGRFESNENNKTTASDGSFAFVSLAAGTYTFRIVAPAGEMISGNAAITVTLGSGGVDQNVNFTLLAQPKPLTGTVIGTSGSYNNQGNTAAKAFDGNLSTFFDAPAASGSWAGLDLGTPTVITQISYAPRSGWASRMVGGMFQASNSATFTSGVVTLYTVASTPATGVLTTVSISNNSAYRYVRYIGPANAYCNIAEAQFFGAATPTLTGTTIGTSGSYNNQGNTIANVFDGNLSTYFDGPDATGDWVGLDLGTAQVVTQVEYAPRAGWTNRMVGGEIQASNSADFSSGVVTLYTITTAPPAGVLTTASFTNTTAYRYYRYIGPTDGYCNIAELIFNG